MLIGKFLAALTLYVAMLVSTLALSRPSLWYFAPLEWGAAGLRPTSGCSSWAAAFLAVGMFVSSLTENQIIAALGTFGVC